MIDLAATLARISYKPGITMRVEQAGASGGAWVGFYALRISACVPDRDNGRPIAILNSQLFDEREFHDERDFVEFVHRQLRMMEAHECDEWFRFNGVRMFDPHSRDERPHDQHA